MLVSRENLDAYYCCDQGKIHQSPGKERTLEIGASSTSDLLQPTARIDQFLLMHSARLDNWREITGLAEEWQAGAAQRADLDAAVAAMEAVEGYHAYPGRESSPCCANHCRQRLRRRGESGARISNGLMTRAYRERPSEWDPNAEMGVDEVADIMPPGLEGSERRRPYFEVLFVQPSRPRVAGAGRRAAPAAPAGGRVRLRAGVRRVVRGCVLRRGHQPGDRRGRRAEGFPFRSRYEAPVLRAVLDTLGEAEDRDTSALRLAGALKRIRPELDIYLLSDRQVEELAGDPAADCVRRVFYAVEEPLEMHLSILEGVPTASRRRSSTT